MTTARKTDGTRHALILGKMAVVVVDAEGEATGEPAVSGSMTADTVIDTHGIVVEEMTTGGTGTAAVLVVVAVTDTMIGTEGETIPATIRLPATRAGLCLILSFTGDSHYNSYYIHPQFLLLELLVRLSYGAACCSDQ